jgi:hypothetical protein
MVSLSSWYEIELFILKSTYKCGSILLLLKTTQIAFKGSYYDLMN